MRLLRASPISAPEFVSLSLLMEPNTMDMSASSTGEPLILVSPSATLSNGEAVDALSELNSHLTSVLTPMAVPNREDRVAFDLFKEDEKLLLDEIQIFRPLCASGIGLHFRLIRGDVDLVSSLAAMVLASNKNSATSRPPPPGVLAVVFCVGVSGLPFAHSTSPIQYFLSQRMNDCSRLLNRISADDSSAMKTLLSTFLLSEDEHRTTNLMVEAANFFVIPDTEESGEKRGVLSPMNLVSPLAEGVAAVRKRMSMSVGTKESAQADTGVAIAMRPNSSEATRHMTDRLTVMSVVEDGTFLRKYEMSGQERKANLDLTGAGKSRFRSRKGAARDADFDGFDYKGPVKEKIAVRRLSVEPSAAATSGSVGGLAAPPGSKLPLRQPKKDTRSKSIGFGGGAGGGGSAVPTLSAPRGRRMSNQAEDDVSFQSGSIASARPRPSQNQKQSRRGSRGHFDDEASETSRSLSITHGGGDASSVASQARVQVNIALNEDLSCSYKLSQLSSCSVEGVVQVQVKSNARSGVPFFLLMRDPSQHLESLQENKKFADDVSDGLVHEHDESAADRKFTVSVPKAENYFPVLRYKCVGDLRPVPIRVQTRVKVDGGFCRVALQISSNPNNEAKLTDLTIIMGVPSEVRGDTLITQPAGGVWNEQKRSVIWCVSELGEGEKFQLQARFEIAGGPEKPKFPVLVRCQCLFAQLSDVELEVRDIPDVFPAEVTMKLARRFRLSHRERS